MHTIKLIDKILFIAGGDKDTYTFSSGQLFKLWLSRAAPKKHARRRATRENISGRFCQARRLHKSITLGERNQSQQSP